MTIIKNYFVLNARLVFLQNFEVLPEAYRRTRAQFIRIRFACQDFFLMEKLFLFLCTDPYKPLLPDLYYIISRGKIFVNILLWMLINLNGPLLDESAGL